MASLFYLDKLCTIIIIKITWFSGHDPDVIVDDWFRVLVRIKSNNLYRYHQGERDTDIQIHFPEEHTFYPTNGAAPSTIDLLITKGDPSTPIALSLEIKQNVIKYSKTTGNSKHTCRF